MGVGRGFSGSQDREGQDLCTQRASQHRATPMLTPTAPGPGLRPQQLPGERKGSGSLGHQTCGGSPSPPPDNTIWLPEVLSVSCSRLRDSGFRSGRRLGSPVCSVLAVPIKSILYCSSLKPPAVRPDGGPSPFSRECTDLLNVKASSVGSGQGDSECGCQVGDMASGCPGCSKRRVDCGV